MSADLRTTQWRMRPSAPHDQIYPGGFIVYRGRRKYGDWFLYERDAAFALTQRRREGR